LQQFQTVLDGIQAETPVSLDAVAIVQMSQRYCLAQMARVIANTTFVSRSDADAVLAQMNAAFDPAEEEAADEHDSGNYQNLIALHGAVTRDLVKRSILLPQRITFEFGRSMPSRGLPNASIMTDGPMRSWLRTGS
jgi:hypothetical protein